MPEAQYICRKQSPKNHKKIRRIDTESINCPGHFDTSGLCFTTALVLPHLAGHSMTFCGALCSISELGDCVAEGVSKAGHFDTSGRGFYTALVLPHLAGHSMTFRGTPFRISEPGD